MLCALVCRPCVLGNCVCSISEQAAKYSPTSARAWREGNGDGDVLVLLKFGAGDATVTLPAEVLRAGWRAATIDALSGGPAARRDDGAIIVPPYGVRILQRPQQRHASRARGAAAP